jgi:hypothetical protein
MFLVVVVGSYAVLRFCGPIALPPSDLLCAVVWFNQHCLPRSGGCWFVVVHFSPAVLHLFCLFPELKVCVLVRRRFGALAVLSMALQW